MHQVVSTNLGENLDKMLQEFAQETGEITNKDIIYYGNKAGITSQKTMNYLFRELNSICDDLSMSYALAMKVDEDAKNLAARIIEAVKS